MTGVHSTDSRLLGSVGDCIEDLCDRFEAAWRSGDRPQIDPFLSLAPPQAHRRLLRELVALELEYRLRLGEKPELDEYLRRFTQDRETVTAFFSDAFLWQGSPDEGAIEFSYQQDHDIKILSSETPGGLRFPDCKTSLSLPSGGSGTEGAGHSRSELPPPAATKAPIGDPQRPEPGQGALFGRFQILRLLGEGQFGRVYHAHDPLLHRDVALKIPSQGMLGDPQNARRFLREARAAAELRHPNIVPIHEMGRVDTTCYLACALVEGQTLQQRLAGGTRHPVREAVELVLKLAKALHFAHTKGVVHRDIKPGNIILDSAGEPHLMDFGLARRDNVETERTTEGGQLGTPAYMSPEQARGESHLADARSDLWSLGVVLYELLGGVRPFSGNVQELIAAIADQDPPPLRSFDKTIPRDLQTICGKCLAKTPRERYAGCDELAAELHRYLSGEPIRARPLGRIDRAWRWAKRNRTIAGLTAAMTAILLSGIGTSAYFVVRARHREAEASNHRLLAQESEAKRQESLRLASERISLEQRTNYNSRLREAGLLIGERPNDALRLLDGIPNVQPDLRDFTWRYLRRKAAPWSSRVLFREDSGIDALRVSPDGQMIGTRGKDNRIRLRDSSSGQLKGDLATKGDWRKGPIKSFCFAPDSRCLAYFADDDTVCVWDVVGSRNQMTWKLDSPNDSNMIEFSPSGKFLVLYGPTYPAPGLIHGNGSVWKLQEDSAKLAVSGQRPLFSSDESLLAVTVGPKKIAVFDVKTMKPIGQAEAEGIPSCMSPDSKLLVTGRPADSSGEIRRTEPNWELQVWQLPTCSLKATLVGHTDFSTAQFSTDGGTLVTIERNDGKTIFWDTATWHKKEAAIGNRLLVHSKFLRHSSLLVTAGFEKNIRIWSPATGTLYKVLSEHDDPVTAMDSASDGTLYSTSSGGVVRKWRLPDADDDIYISEPRSGFGSAPSLAFDPGGRHLAVATGTRHGGMVAIRDCMQSFRLCHSFCAQSREADQIDPRAQSVVYSADGQILVTAGGVSGFGHIRAWSTKDHRLLWDVLVAGNWVRSVALSADDRYLAYVVNDKDAALMDMKTRAVRTLTAPEYQDDRMHAVAFSRSGPMLATIGKRGVYQWSVPEGRILRTIGPRNLIANCLAFSPDGRTLAIGEQHDKSIKLYDVETGELKGVAVGHERYVHAIAFSPDGATMASLSPDKTVRLWDPVTGQPRAVYYPRSTGSGFSIAFSPDGNLLASGGSNGLRIWRGDVRLGEADLP